MRRVGRSVIVAATLSAALASQASAAFTTLDPTFGIGGKVIRPEVFAGAAALQPDGKLVVLGALQLARLATDGSLDPAFGTSGVVTIDPGVPLVGMFAFTLPEAVVVRPDGRIAALLRIVDSPSLFDNGWLLAQYEADGTPDETFGLAGVVVSPLPSPEVLVALGLTPGGHLVAAGTYNPSPSPGPAQVEVRRFSEGGSPDGAFGLDGVVTTSFGLGDTATTLAVQDDGHLLVGGTTAAATFTGPQPLQLLRYNADGTPDLTFGVAGRVTTTLDNERFTVPAALAIETDGKIVAACSVHVGTADTIGDTSAIAVVRWMPDGTLDPSFGTAGWVRTQLPQLPAALEAQDIGGAGAAASALVVQADGTILVGGQYEEPSYFVVLRFDASGALDPSFGPCRGIVTGFAHNDLARLAELFVRPDGAIDAVGGTSNAQSAGTGGMVLVRYRESATPCLPATATKATITFREGPGNKPESNNLIVKWAGAGPASLAGFGDPTASTDISVCLLDDPTSVAPKHAFLVETHAAAGQVCDGKPCWTRSKSGFRYMDAGPTPTGPFKALLKPSAGVGHAAISFQSRGAQLSTPALYSLVPPLTLRISASDGSGCWEATFSTATTNKNASRLHARSD